MFKNTMTCIKINPDVMLIIFSWQHIILTLVKLQDDYYGYKSKSCMAKIINCQMNIGSHYLHLYKGCSCWVVQR